MAADYYPMTTNPLSHYPALLDRKAIAKMIDVSADQVRRNEKRWELDKARVDLTPRCVRYRSVVVVRLFLKRGWI
jgi:hypothetical protein